jgi:hypothetical protein
MVEEEGFEPSKHEAADLQSAGFDRSPTPPFKGMYFCSRMGSSQLKFTNWKH